MTSPSRSRIGGCRKRPLRVCSQPAAVAPGDAAGAAARAAGAAAEIQGASLLDAFYFLPMFGIATPDALDPK